jgi:phenylacetate-CoA ligase
MQENGGSKLPGNGIMTRTPLDRWISAKIGNNSEALTRESIDCYQLAKLQETLAWAKGRSAFYQRRLADVNQQGFSSLADLRGIPFTTAEDVKSNPLQFLCVSQGDIERVVTLRSSGTTGQSKRIYFTREDQELTVDFFHRGMATLVGHGDKVLILLPGERPGSVGDLLAAGLGRLGVRGVAYGPVQDYAQALEVMIREGIDALVGIPVQVLTLARQSRGRGAPRSVLLSTDYVPKAVREELTRIWGCEVYTHYGMTEMGYGGGVECRARYGYHMREADLLFEIIDAKTGTPVKEGESGEVVFTTLTRRGMPLIRYRTGDLSRFHREPCPCGTGLKTMAPVTGRLSNQLELEPGTVLTMADLDEALFPIRGLVDFAAELTCRNGRNHLNITATLLAGEDEDRSEELWRVLKGIAPLRAHIAEGKLELGLAVRKGSPQPLNGVTKRTLSDMRN